MAIDHEQADAAAVMMMAGGAGGDDQIIRPRRGDYGGLFPAQHIVVAVATRRGGDAGEIEACTLFSPGQCPDLLARDNVGDKILLLIAGAELFDQAPRKHDGFDKGLDHQPTTELVHDDHGR